MLIDPTLPGMMKGHVQSQRSNTIKSGAKQTAKQFISIKYIFFSI